MVGVRVDPSPGPGRAGVGVRVLSEGSEFLTRIRGRLELASDRVGEQAVHAQGLAAQVLEDSFFDAAGMALVLGHEGTAHHGHSEYDAPEGEWEPVVGLLYSTKFSIHASAQSRRGFSTSYEGLTFAGGGRGGGGGRGHRGGRGGRGGGSVGGGGGGGGGGSGGGDVGGGGGGRGRGRSRGGVAGARGA
jgi:hypothetical protein